MRAAGKGLLRVDAHRQGHQIRGHELAHGGEIILPAQILWRDDAYRQRAVDHDGRAVGALVQKVAGIAHRVVRLDGDWGVIDQVSGLYRGDRLRRGLQAEVLRQDGHAAAPGDGFCHAAAGHSGHIRHDERDGIARAIGCGEVDRLPRANIRVVRHHKYIRVGQLVGRAGIIEEMHCGIA